jgi:hypothetical protein
VESINLRKISEVEVRKQYQVKISNRFAALESLNDSEEKKQGLGKQTEYQNLS